MIDCDTRTSVKEMFGGARDAVFVLDGSNRILFSNDMFARLCGKPKNLIHGSRCEDIVCGMSPDGSPFCGRKCSIGTQSDVADTADNFDIVVPQATGIPVLVNVGVLPAPRAWRPAQTVVVMRPVDVQKLLARLANPPQCVREEGRPSHKPLTSRESQILAMLVKGESTVRIADSLHISPTTARNHIRSILCKLGVHSRSEAVSYAYRHALVPLP